MSKTINVPYLDLSVNDNNHKNELINRIKNVLTHGKIIEGPEQHEFEKKFADEIGVKYALGVSSGSSALYLSLLGAGIGYGDEVITTPFTWVITVNAISATGAKPVFADIKDDFNINPNIIEKCITRNTRAIVPVHIAGHMCDMESISKIAKEHKLLIIEDAAQAFCASLNKKRAGSFSSVAGFSMNPMKILHAYGEAGAITTNNKRIYEKIKQLRHAGTKRDKNAIDINFCNYVSLNHKIDTIQASMLLANLERINIIKNKRDEIASLYDEYLTDNVTTQTTYANEVHGRYIYIMSCNKRNLLRKHLLDKQIENKVFYSPLVCDAHIYKKSYCNVPNSRRLLKHSLSIPMHENINLEQVEYVIKTINQFYK